MNNIVMSDTLGFNSVSDIILRGIKFMEIFEIFDTGVSLVLDCKVTFIVLMLCSFVTIFGKLFPEITTSGYRGFVGIIGAFLGTFNHSDGNHYSGNMICFLAVSPFLEVIFGTRKYSIIMIALIIVNSVIDYVCNLMSNQLMRGFSGVVFSLQTLIVYAGGVDNGIELTLLMLSLFYVIKEISDTFDDSINNNVLPNGNRISHKAHLIGAVVGLVIGWYFKFGQ